MCNVIYGLIVLAALAFVVAVLTAVFHFGILGIQAEGFSRACTNLALIAIALAVCFKKEPSAS